uniref:DUF6533 domain-containing protein n=1 Tax=Moniliophthora roreri TaxID=221103 RepID=A0A0W0FE00_MONRR
MPDPAAAAELARKLLNALNHQRIVSYVDVLSTFLLVYDVILNVNLELRHIWGSKWSLLNVLYIIQRYIPFFDTAVMVLHHQFATGLSPRYCSINYRISGWCFIGGIVVSELVLTLRLWAVWRRSTPIAIGLAIFFLGCWVPCFVLLNQFLKSMTFAVPPLPHFRGCFISGGSHILYMCWVLMMIYDTGTLIMIIIPGIRAYRLGGSSELLNAVYRDGVIYYAFIFLVSVINVIVIVTLPPDLVHLLSSFERVLHSILTSRAILHIRNVASRDRVFSVTEHPIPLSTVPVSTFRTAETDSTKY